VEKFCGAGKAIANSMTRANFIVVYRSLQTQSQNMKYLTAFPLQQWLHERITLYVNSLFC